MDWGNALGIGGLMAAGGIVATFWRSGLQVVRQLWSRIVVTMDVQGSLVGAITYYAWHHFDASAYGRRAYLGWHIFVRKHRRTELVPLEIGNENKLFWKGWRPVWIKALKGEKDKNNPGLGDGNVISISFLRGTLDPDRFLEDVCQAYNAARIKYDPYENSNRKRHYVRILTGTADWQSAAKGDQPPAAGGNHDSDDMQWAASSHRVVGYDIDELGRRQEAGSASLDLLSLDSAAAAFVQKIRLWLDAEEWYRQRSIPWRRGVLLSGSPGTGKTSLVRAIAEDLDLPVYIFDLRTLRNSEMMNHWQEMLSNTPCIALIEDIDAVFHGRENVCDNSSLSFDCLLNCIDGVRRGDGVILAVTTNNHAKIDEAMLRSGRIDQSIEMGPLDERQCLSLAQRILADYPERIEDAVRLCVGKTGAEAQELCSQIALHSYYGLEGEPALICGNGAADVR